MNQNLSILHTAQSTSLKQRTLCKSFYAGGSWMITQHVPYFSPDILQHNSRNEEATATDISRTEAVRLQ